MYRGISVLVLTFILFGVIYCFEDRDDMILGGLPGQPHIVKFKQYAGYITVDKSKGRTLFYYFAEARQNSSSKPLILWLNGGPGCSSLGISAMTEIGPFGVRKDGKTLYERRFAWNKVANLLFLESPAGVGFSYSNTSSDYNTIGDERTAEDSHIFLKNWFKRFPQYKSSNFYIMGESYAGHYVPQLADLIIQRNILTDPSTNIQLKGIMIGNGNLNNETSIRGLYDYMWSHALISDETYEGLLEYCFGYVNQECSVYEKQIPMEMNGTNVYNIYGESCRANSSVKYPDGKDSCEQDYVTAYLNTRRVQEALHANITKLPYAWNQCSSVLFGKWHDGPASMYPIYEKLIAYGLRILIYSGDADAVVPVTATRYSIKAMNLTVKRAWRPWLDRDEVAGFRVDYDGLTFCTVKGAGHQAPRDQPRRALQLLETFLEDL